MALLFTTDLTAAWGPVRFGFAEDGALVRVWLRPAAEFATARGPRPAGAPRRAQLRRWLDDYAAGRDVVFPGEWRVEGARAFRQRVYAAVAAIPTGATRSYGEVAAAAGSPGAARAVGTAMAANPLPLVVP